jgi:hypothetical protein
MSDEEKTPEGGEIEGGEKAPEKAPEKEPDFNEIEQVAMKIGWNPKHKEGDREYVSAEDFIVRSKEIQGTMSKQLKTQTKKIDALTDGLRNLKNHNEAVFKANVASVKREVAKLKAERNEAAEDGDKDIVANIDAQIKELEKTPTELPKEAQQPDPAFLEWKEDNAWYENDKELRAYADAQGEAPEFKGLPYETLLKKVTGRVKKMFPEKFGETKEATKTPSAQTVEAAKIRGGGKKKFTFSDLTSEQKKLCKTFEDTGVMKRDEYIADLVKIGELK